MTEFDKKWYMKYEQLVDFKRKHGHCRVPSRYEQDKALAEWVVKQRFIHKNDKIRPDRKTILDEIGFVWKVESPRNTNDKVWQHQYEKVVEFKRINGHARVPFKHEQDKSLGRWVSDQRVCYKANKLRLDRKMLLDEIGFAWKVDPDHYFKPDDKIWHQQYEKLVEFKRKKGHCKVTQKYKEDASLGIWVLCQRQRYAKNKMRPDRKKLLDKIGFAWNYCTLAARASTMNNSDSEAFTSSEGLPNEAPPEKSEPLEGQARNKCPSPTRKRPSTCLVESGQMTATSRTKQRGNAATDSCSSVERDGGAGRDEQDSKPSLVTSRSSALIGFYPDQEVVQQEEAATPDEIPSGWTRVKLEPDC